VEERAPTFDQETLGRAVLDIINVSTLGAVERRLAELERDLAEADVEKVTRKTLENGRKLSALDYFNAVQILHRTAREVARFFQDYPILVSPVLLQPPVPLGWLDMMTENLKEYGRRMSEFFGFTQLFNVTGQPSMSVPLYWTKDGLPVGVQFSAPFGEEGLLFRLASQLEEARPWKDKRPPLPD
jgi:amidase/6-aminohexanoate-cyclic-dimer hydrolase